MTAELRIGTSGWSYRHWRGRFYPGDVPLSRALAYYTGIFDTVEINSSFYRLPPESALANWRDSTPPGFLFAVKGSRFLTHMKKLKDTELGLERFFSRAELLGAKLGPILFQLPPRFEVNLERLEKFLEALPVGHRYSFEFRDPTWNVEPVYEALRRHNAAFCMYHLAGYQSPLEVTADFTYVRLHGPGGKYQGSYSEADLARWAERIAGWLRKLAAVYVYFDNDQDAYAALDAQRLRSMLA
jgi:uncharacterized protein YecE (DUF72 family)